MICVGSIPALSLRAVIRACCGRHLFRGYQGAAVVVPAVLAKELFYVVKWSLRSHDALFATILNRDGGMPAD
jgi:hypothetical protein